MLWHAGSAEEEGTYFTALMKGFADLGYVDGKTAHFKHRYANEQYDRFPAQASELTARDRKIQRSIDHFSYRQRNLIERFFNKLKHVGKRRSQPATTKPRQTSTQRAYSLPTGCQTPLVHDLDRDSGFKSLDTKSRKQPQAK